MRARRTLGLVVLTLAVLTSGCLAGGVAETPTEAPQSSPEERDCAAWVAFYGLSDPAQRTWAPDRVSIGYTVPPGASVLFVASVDGTVRGSTHVSTEGYEHGITADGDGVPLDRALNGTHEIRVTAYRDVDGDGAFDAGTDEPCRDEGERVRTDRQRIDFSQFHSDTPSPTPSPSE